MSTTSLYVPNVPSTAQYQKEAELATAAVLRACHITQKVQKAIKKVATEEKPDKSPVTGELIEFGFEGGRRGGKKEEEEEEEEAKGGREERAQLWTGSSSSAWLSG